MFFTVDEVIMNFPMTASQKGQNLHFPALARSLIQIAIEMLCIVMISEYHLISLASVAGEHHSARSSNALFGQDSCNSELTEFRARSVSRVTLTNNHL